MAEPDAPQSSALVGVAAAAIALGVTQLAAVPFGPGAEGAIQLFGTADKLALSIVVLAVITVIAALTGQRETGRIPLGSIAIVLAGVAGSAAVLTRAGGTWADVIPTVVGTLCGVVVLRLLVSARFAKGNSAASSGQDAERVPDSGRRQWMAASGLLAIGVASGVAGTVLNRLRSSVAGDRKAFALPPAVADAPPIPATVHLTLEDAAGLGS